MPFDLLESQLRESAKNSLQFELYSNAAFLCERLLAEIKNSPHDEMEKEEIKLMLADCYMGNKDL